MGAFRYSLSQTTVYALEDKIRTDLLKNIQEFKQITIPPRIIPNPEYELALRVKGMQQPIFPLFNEIYLIRLLYLFYFPHNWGGD